MHAAADGGLARIRVPGGRLTSAQLGEVADAASDCGTGVIELTSRANVQVRGLGGGSRFAARMADAGLLPSATHERVRNILASPLTGCDTEGTLDAGPLVTELDLRLCGTPALAALPGRFLFALDDGRGDVAWLGPDAGILPTGPGEAALILAGADSGLRVPAGSAVTALLTAAEAFLTEPAVEQARAWRIGELPGCAERVAAAVEAALETRSAAPARLSRAVTRREPVGIVEQPGGRAALGVAVPLGRLTSAQARLLADLASGGEARLTPWRGVVLPGLTPGEAAAARALVEEAGLVTDPGSPWTGVTACTGRPGCAKSLADVQADATRATTSTTRTGTLPVHWAGCERRCGRPRGRVADVVATAAGYRVDLDGRSLECADIEETAAVVTALRGET
ncbi:precorrin-3B synthase [Streptosporangium carneum]|uniref:Precorrin-3B synthase n=1 Tax=Streptosporangium carneum TaxID=47481 RepID=A0A9W6MH71_9ACTN|nr:precorrin-3B synthase [Streptosporangium carneum]